MISVRSPPASQNTRPLTSTEKQQAPDLSLRHSRTLEHYRQAHEISGRAGDGWVPIQELRQAMTHSHGLFHDLIGRRQARREETSAPDVPRNA